MKLLKLNKLNRVIKKYSSLILSAILIVTKKDKLSNIVILIITMIGFLCSCDDTDNTKKGSKDWKTFISNQLNKNKCCNKKINEDEDKDEVEDEVEDEVDIYTEEDKKDDDEHHKETESMLKIFNRRKNIQDKNIGKRMNKIIDKNINDKAYPNKINKLNKEYSDNAEKIFKLKVNNNNKNTPIFNLRSSDTIDFYWNFHLHNADNSKINSLILCRDIHQWMNNSSLSNEDLEDQCYPVYLIMKDHKTDNEIMIFEAYKIFVYPNENGNKHALITKGDNYKTIEEILNILIEKKYIQNLLNTKEYESYNLTSHDSVCLFLNNLLSHFLPYESQDNEVINIDLEQYNENRNTFDYFYHTNNMDSDMFNTNI